MLSAGSAEPMAKAKGMRRYERRILVRDCCGILRSVVNSESHPVDSVVLILFMLSGLLSVAEICGKQNTRTRSTVGIELVVQLAYMS
jgi:hypothetical protein